LKLVARIVGMSALILVLGEGEAFASALYRAASTADPAPGSILGVGAALSLLGLRRVVRRNRTARFDPLRPLRRRAVITVKSVATAPWVEGRSDDPRIGEFAGFVFAKGVLVPAGGADRRGSTRYWVQDAQKSVPVWVRLEEIGQCRWPQRSNRPQPAPMRRSVLDEDVAVPVGLPTVRTESARVVERAEEPVCQDSPSPRRRRGSRARQEAA
jgi:hypothetical protein